ncbi:hypothetical protein SAMN04488688_104118 [Paenibacillus sp. cl141a]|nr:hypothetical protein SAMN04488688_104118 [Paenibacillus sp. cl141a]
MKEEVRDIRALIVILYNVRIDPCRTERGRWRAVGPHFMLASQL